MREKHQLLSNYIAELGKVIDLCHAKIGTWSEAHLKTDNKIYKLLDIDDIITTLHTAGLRCGDIVFAITDNPISSVGIYFASHKVFINSPYNIDTNVIISYKDIRNIDVDEEYNICTITTYDGREYRLSSDLWDNVALADFIQYAVDLTK